MENKYNEQSVLDQGFRAKVIKEITGNENKARKNEAFKAYECFKDMSYRYVINALLQQFDPATVQEMQYALTNISFTRKIIDKLARVYSNGVKRTMPKKRDTAALEDYSRISHLNQTMKKTNRYLKLFKNTAVYICPKPIKDKFEINVNPIAPFFYDVIEYQDNPERPMCYIMSNYRPSADTMYKEDAGIHSINPIRSAVVKRRGDGVDEIIADSNTDKPQDTFIWWTDNFHFTTDVKGNIISEGDGINPIGKLPFVNFALDQDGGFWALGGYDIVMGGININSLLTNINHIAITQGYGQLTMTGKNLPKSIKVGPNHAIQIESEAGDPTPTISYISANPPISDLMKVVEMYVALLLSTNNLSTSGFSASLSGPANFASGVALMIDKSESIEDTEDQAQLFKDNEPLIWDIISKWNELYDRSGLLVESQSKTKIPNDYSDLVIKFPESQVMVSEKEKLENLNARKDLGINTLVEIMMLDQPDLTEDMARKKLLEIQKEKADRMASSMIPSATNQDQQMGMMDTPNAMQEGEPLKQESEEQKGMMKDETPEEVVS